MGAIYEGAIHETLQYNCRHDNEAEQNRIIIGRSAGRKEAPIPGLELWVWHAKTFPRVPRYLPLDRGSIRKCVHTIFVALEYGL